jgi:hypothetical protein
MVKRSSRLAKRNALQAIEDAIGSSLGKKPAAAPNARDASGSVKTTTQEPHQRAPKK